MFCARARALLRGVGVLDVAGRLSCVSLVARVGVVFARVGVVFAPA
jgi:hypothetical protein